MYFDCTVSLDEVILGQLTVIARDENDANRISAEHFAARIEVIATPTKETA